MEEQYKAELNVNLAMHLINSEGLSLQFRRAHWDVTGMAFGPLHELFGELYNYMAGHSDDIAERQRQLGFFTTLVAEDLPTAKYGPGLEPLDDVTLVTNSANNLESFIEDIRLILQYTNQTTDFTTTNWLSGVIQDLEKYLWKLRAIVGSVSTDDV